MKAYGKIKPTGQLHIVHRKNFDQELANMARSDRDIPVEIEVTKRKNHKTLSQNAYYWAVLVTMVQERLEDLYGEKFNKQQVHYEWLMEACGQKEIVNVDTGEIKYINERLSKFGKGKMIEYIDECIKWCHESLEITIPAPTEQVMLHFDDENLKTNDDENRDEGDQS